MAGLDGCELQLRQYEPSEYSFSHQLTRAAYERYGPFDWLADQPNESLEKLHELHAWLGGMGVGSTEPPVINTRETDQRASYYDDLYTLTQRRPGFKSSYLNFIEHEVQPLFNEPVVFQRVPTFRVHMPGNLAVGEYHTDAKYGHPEEAVNFWVPVTDASGSNSLHVQTGMDTKPRPLDVEYGEYVIFDGVSLLHGNEINDTDRTRVSFDFRVIPESQFKSSNKISVNSSIPFKVGEDGYYSLLTDENLVRQREKIDLESAKIRAWEERIRNSCADNKERDSKEYTIAERIRRLYEVLFFSR